MEDWEWLAVITASLQPPGNAHWAAILDELFSDLENYLQFFASL